MDLLILLVERRGELVTRAEIVERLWGKDVFIEIETGINTLIRKIRRALGDSADAPVFVETVQGKGYRFIAPAQTVPAAPVEPALVVKAEGHGAFACRGWTRTFAAAAALMISAAALWQVARPARTPVTLAVLPFRAIGIPPEYQYLPDALHEETITSLGQMDRERLVVVGRQAMLAYANSTESPREIGSKLAVQYILESGLQAGDGQVRLTARLVRASDQAQVWSESYERRPTSLLGLQNELSADIARQIHLRLSSERLSALNRRHTSDAEAYDLYLQGLYFWNQLKPETNRRAIESYTRATERDPNYALAWAGLALVYAGAPINADAPPQAMWPKAREAASRALRADADLAEVHTASGMVQFWLDWDWSAAEAAFRKAVELDPNYALAHRMVGITLAHRGQHTGAGEPMRRLREIEPLYGMNWALSAQVAFNARDYEAALEFARRATVIAPGFYVGDYHVAMAAERLGRYDLALDTLNKSLSIGNTNSKLHALRGYVLARTGQASEARAILEMMQAGAKTQYIPPYAMALVHAGLGDRDTAFAWLDRAYDVHDVHLVALPTDAKWDPFREDARFSEIVRRCGFAIRS